MDSDVQSRVCAILLLLQRAELNDKYGDLKYANLTIIGDDETIFSEGFIEEYRSLFPVGKKSTEGEVKHKLSILFSEVDTTEEQVLNATKHYLSTVTNLTYCEKAGNFISKQAEGTMRSTLREFLETTEVKKSSGYGTRLT